MKNLNILGSFSKAGVSITSPKSSQISINSTPKTVFNQPQGPCKLIILKLVFNYITICILSFLGSPLRKSAKCIQEMNLFDTKSE